jgi:hypothetical protein
VVVWPRDPTVNNSKDKDQAHLRTTRVFLDNRVPRVSGVLVELEGLTLLSIATTKDGLEMIVCLNLLSDAMS